MVSHQIIVELWAGQDIDLAKTLHSAVAALALLPDCIRYGLYAHPLKANTWTIEGEWACPQAMTAHLQSAAMQRLLGELCALRVYCLEFVCQAGFMPPAADALSRG